MYFVDNANDTVFENANEATTRCFPPRTSASANVEYLILQGTADLHGYGNGPSNALFGNAGDNLLDGKAGADFMVGGVATTSTSSTMPATIVSRMPARATTSSMRSPTRLGEYRVR